VTPPYRPPIPVNSNMNSSTRPDLNTSGTIRSPQTSSHTAHSLRPLTLPPRADATTQPALGAEIQIRNVYAAVLVV
jgi:hypothetical protein